MSEHEDKESKTEEPTEKKIQDAVEKGQTAFSKELPVLFTLTAITAIIGFGANGLTARLKTYLQNLMDTSSQLPLNTTADVLQVMNLYWQIGVVVLGPVLLGLAFAGLAGSLVQNPPRLVAKRIKPELSRISLKKGFERIFGPKGWAEFFKVLAKIVFTAGCIAFFAAGIMPVLSEGPMTASAVFLTQIGRILFGLLFTMVLAMTLIAVADLVWTNRQWLKDLRMSHKEIKDEHKQAEGDPMVKARMQSIARERARKRMMNQVPKATLVLTNPTHYAIALRYSPPGDQAPVVLAKGQDLIALRIREIAAEHNIAVHENPALTRAMYKAVTVDQIIPREFFEAVAEIIVYLNKQPARN
ncbi:MULTISPECIES: flagellar type III secretion system protein FlhB [unclassified Roseitalea]|uniref:EscU/YscU/HrcU family type III secretion system export apparatus switch protein n=1 Tax=unclassified Roseitalea TaxID=2639107 RepID=UPI00273D6F3E|nr:MULTISPECIES: flagellar type III secretion system protein FlhB [unclassified Roseitalea]